MVTIKHGLTKPTAQTVHDVYTNSEGHLVIRLVNAESDVLTVISFSQDALAQVKRGMLDNQRLQPNKGY